MNILVFQRFFWRFSKTQGNSLPYGKKYKEAVVGQKWHSRRLLESIHAFGTTSSLIRGGTATG